jgi:hypothetical protein
MEPTALVLGFVPMSHQETEAPRKSSQGTLGMSRVRYQPCRGCFMGLSFYLAIRWGTSLSQMGELRPNTGKDLLGIWSFLSCHSGSWGTHFICSLMAPGMRQRPPPAPLPPPCEPSAIVKDRRVARGPTERCYTTHLLTSPNRRLRVCSDPSGMSR